MRSTTRLRQLLTSPTLSFLMEAHNGLSAKIVEEAGFAGIWASGLAISAQFGLRDNNEASWSQVLDILDFITDTTPLPVLLDGDTGYGNFNNARMLVKKLEKIAVAGVCIEDKLFPKSNSLLKGEPQSLAKIEEFTGKIKAIKDTQKDDDFVLVARTEAFISGWGLNHALERAEAYRRAGADAILCHSKRSTHHEVAAFMHEWGERHPVVIVPTTYWSTPTSTFERLGISMVIWANHTLRAAIASMKQVTRNIYETRSLVEAERAVVPLTEIFRLQNVEELKEAEAKYLPLQDGSCGPQAKPRNNVYSLRLLKSRDRLPEHPFVVNL